MISIWNDLLRACLHKLFVFLLNLWIFALLNELDWPCILWRIVCRTWRFGYIYPPLFLVLFLQLFWSHFFYSCQEIPLPQGATHARRIGRSLCIADQTNYSLVDLERASLFPILPLSQAYEPAPFVVNPSITVIGRNEFLILSWTGTSTLGVFISGEGDPVRGTLQWPSHPKAICQSAVLSFFGVYVAEFVY